MRRNEELSACKKSQIFFSTFLVFSGFYFLFGVISRIKKPLALQLNFSSSFLGLIDGLLFAGAALGSAYIAVSPVKKPCLSTFIFSLLCFLSMEIQLLGDWIPSLIYPTHIISRFLFGFFDMAPIISISIINHYFQGEQNQNLVQIWFSLGSIGDCCGILVSELFLTTFNLNWRVAMTLSLLIYCIFCFYMYFVVDEIPMQETLGESGVISQFKSFASDYFRIKVNILHSLIFFLLSLLYYVMVLWLPYFFTQIGFQKQSFLLSATYPALYPLGVLLIQPLSSLFKNHKGFLFFSMMILSTSASLALWFVGDDPSDIPIYFSLLFITAVMVSGFFCYTTTTDLSVRTDGTRQFMMINAFNRCTMRVAQAFSLLLSGILLQKDSRGFLKYYTGISIMCSIILVIRLCAYPDSYSYIQAPEKIQNRELELLQ